MTYFLKRTCDRGIDVGKENNFTDTFRKTWVAGDLTSGNVNLELFSRLTIARNPRNFFFGNEKLSCCSKFQRSSEKRCFCEKLLRRSHP